MDYERKAHRQLLEEGGREVQKIDARPLEQGPQDLHETLSYLCV